MRLKYIIILLLSASSLWAQVGEHRNDLAIGVNGGYVLNQVAFDIPVKQKFHGGTTFGLTGRYTCEKYFAMLCAIQMEVNYAQMGWTEDMEGPYTYQRDINYLQIPFLANLGYGKERGGLKGFLLLGPQVGFCLSESEKMSSGWDTSAPDFIKNGSFAQYGKPVEVRFDYGLTGGLGVDFSTKSGHHFLLDGRYYFALSNVFKNTKQDPFGKSNNGAIIVKLSYLFDVVKTKKE